MCDIVGCARRELKAGIIAACRAVGGTAFCAAVVTASAIINAKETATEIRLWKVALPDIAFSSSRGWTLTDLWDGRIRMPGRR
jgi:hypothetical protein